MSFVVDGPVEVINTIRPRGDGSVWPVVLVSDVAGAPQVFADTAERDAFPAGKLTVGMTCYVVDVTTEYRLTTVDPLEWTEESGGGGLSSRQSMVGVTDDDVVGGIITINMETSPTNVTAFNAFLASPVTGIHFYDPQTPGNLDDLEISILIAGISGALTFSGEVGGKGAVDPIFDTQVPTSYGATFQSAMIRAKRAAIGASAVVSVVSLDDLPANLSDLSDLALQSALDEKADSTHASQHETAGGDPIAPTSIGAVALLGGTAHTPNAVVVNFASQPQNFLIADDAVTLDVSNVALGGSASLAIENTTGSAIAISDIVPCRWLGTLGEPTTLAAGKTMRIALSVSTDGATVDAAYVVEA